MLAFGDHTFVDFLDDGLVVVDTFEADVEEFNAEFLEFWQGVGHDFIFENGASFFDFREDSDGAGLAVSEFLQGFVLNGGAVFIGANDFDEIVFADDAAGGGAEDVFESGVGGGFVAKAKEVGEGIGDLPAAEGVDRDVEFVLGGHFIFSAVPG